MSVFATYGWYVGRKFPWIWLAHLQDVWVEFSSAAPGKRSSPVDRGAQQLHVPGAKVSLSSEKSAGPGFNSQRGP